MKKIIIFKSDMLGDLIMFSPCLKIIKDNNKDTHITLICSNYNFQVAKNYSYVDEFIIFSRKNMFMNIFKNFRKLFFTRYKYLFQFDGKNSSYFISYFISSKIKSTICFIKHKRFLGLNYLISRPSKYLLKIFYNNYIYCDEEYSVNKNDKSLVHYQTIYFNLLEKLNFKIMHKKNLFFLDKSWQEIYNKFFDQFINQKYSLFHIDERWDRYKPIDYENSLKIINKISKKNKLIITTGVKDFTFLKDLNKRFKVFNFINNKIVPYNSTNIVNVMVLKNLPVNLLSYFIKNAEKNISSHTGFVAQISPAFDKDIIDIIPKSKNEELDRWIPVVSKYQRINFEDINENLIDNLF